MKKSLVLAGTIAVTTMGMAGTAFAMNGNADGQYTGDLSTKLAERFNLNKDEVSSFMQERHEARHAEMEAKVSEALKAAGFSDEQVTALQNKKQEQRDTMEAWREANPNATHQEMHTQRDEQKAAFEAWAVEQGIDLTKVRDAVKDAMPMRGGHGRGHARIDSNEE